MLELFKIILDLLALRRAHEQGIMTWKVYAFAIAFVAVLYGTGLGATLLYEADPRYQTLWIAALIFDGLMVVLFLIFGTLWYRRAAARSKATMAAQET